MLSVSWSNTAHKLHRVHRGMTGGLALSSKCWPALQGHVAARHGRHFYASTQFNCCSFKPLRPLKSRIEHRQAASKQALPACAVRACVVSSHGVEAAVQIDDASVTATDTNALQPLIGWLVANGVEGFGTDEDKAAVFSSDGGERGFVSLKDISAGEVVFRIPLRLALTDHPEDAESNRLLYPGAPWSVRLACKLCRQLALGSASPWAPYLAALPKLVPTPTMNGSSWEQIQMIQYTPALEALHEASWLLSDSFASCSGAATGGADEVTFRWAMSVVHSRTFGTAAKGGGVGVRMLLPLVDMLNHGGDQVQHQQQQQQQQQLTDASTIVATDNVRWDLMTDSGMVDDATNLNTGWWMEVKATTDITAGAELLLSYGERANDDFLLHYGFVPLANPHDEVVLFADLVEALEWHHAQYSSQMQLADAAKLYMAAHAAGTDDSPTNHALIANSTAEQVKAAKQLKLLSGARVSEPLLIAFAAAAASESWAEQHAGAAVDRRCWQLLSSMQPPVTHDLALLASDAFSEGDEEAWNYYTSRLRWYHQVCSASRFQQLRQAIQLQGSPRPAMESASPLATEPSDARDTGFARPPSLGKQGIAAKQNAPACSAEELVEQYMFAIAADGQDAPGMGQSLPPPVRLALAFRVQKKMLLFDALQDSSVDAESLTFT